MLLRFEAVLVELLSRIKPINTSPNAFIGHRYTSVLIPDDTYILDSDVFCTACYKDTIEHISSALTLQVGSGRDTEIKSLIVQTDDEMS